MRTRHVIHGYRTRLNMLLFDSPAAYRSMIQQLGYSSVSGYGTHLSIYCSNLSLIVKFLLGDYLHARPWGKLQLDRAPCTCGGKLQLDRAPCTCGRELRQESCGRKAATHSIVCRNSMILILLATEVYFRRPYFIWASPSCVVSRSISRHVRVTSEAVLAGVYALPTLAGLQSQFSVNIDGES